MNKKVHNSRWLAWLTAAGLALTSWVAMAQEASPAATSNSIERIDATQSGNSTVLAIQLKSPVAGIPPSFSVANPARIAIDLPQTVNNLGRNAVEFNQGDLRSVTVVQAQGRARVVLNLRRAMTHAITTDGSTINVALGSAADVTSFKATEAAVASGQTGVVVVEDEPRALRAIDFRRGAEGEGRVVVDLSDPNISVDIRQQGASVVVDFLEAGLPEELRRRLDVTDFGTPVAQVNTFTQGKNTRMVIEPRGLWEHNAYQSDTRFVVEVKPVKEDPTKLFQGTRQGYQGERLSLNFQNVDVRSLLQVIADFTNLNIITSDSVGGTITLRLKDVPWDQALDIILQTKDLDMRKNGNVLLIAPRDELATKEKLEAEARAQLAELEPLHSETFQLNYTKVEAFTKLVTDDKQRILSKRGSAVFDPRTNQMFVQDTASKLEELRKLIVKVDVPVPQVLIEARIVEAEDRFSRGLGMRFGFVRVNNQSWFRSSGQEWTPGGKPDADKNGIGINGVAVNNPNNVNLPAGRIGGNESSTWGLTLFNSSMTRMLNLELSALESEGRGKIISSPRVITADKIKASIEQGTEIPYESSTSSGATSVQFRKAVLKLEVTPQITPEGSILLDVQVHKDSPNVTISTINGNIAIDTKNVRTQVLVENGGTVVLGGIYEQNERNITTQVPLLGDIPILGNLFKTRSKVNDRTELMIFITPRVVSERVTAATAR